MDKKRWAQWEINELIGYFARGHYEQRAHDLWPALDKTSLMCTIRHNNGNPIKTKLAIKLPHLTRRERRILVKAAGKASRQNG